MINGNYFRNKGLLVSRSLLREPEEKQSHKGYRLQEELAASAGGRVGLESSAESAC